jgi:hypothetical protein
MCIYRQHHLESKKKLFGVAADRPVHNKVRKLLKTPTSRTRLE